MLKEFDEFLGFCFVHGGTLRNHKQFGEMARELRAQIEAAEQSVEPTVRKVAENVRANYIFNGMVPPE